MKLIRKTAVILLLTIIILQVVNDELTGQAQARKQEYSCSA